MKRLGYLSSPAGSEVSLRPVETAARNLGFEFQVFRVEKSEEIAAAFDALAGWKAEGLVVPAAVVLTVHHKQVVAHAARTRIPAIYARSNVVVNGGLMSYAPDFADQYRRAAGYVDRILKGAKPADLPVQQPTTFELVVNMKTAKALGLTIPPSVMVLVNRVIE
jgi:putative ABC transport system substrate-binding protein